MISLTIGQRVCVSLEVGGARERCHKSLSTGWRLLGTSKACWYMFDREPQMKESCFSCIDPASIYECVANRFLARSVCLYNHHLPTQIRL